MNNTITFEEIQQSLTIDKRFVLVNDVVESDKGVVYCSIRLNTESGGVGSRKIFCLYYLNRNSVQIHCAKRFESVCDSMFKLNSKKTEYTLTVKTLDELAVYVHALLAYECSLLKWTPYTRNEIVKRESTVTEKKKKEKKAK